LKKVEKLLLTGDKGKLHTLILLCPQKAYSNNRGLKAREIRNGKLTMLIPL
jgi:hypothetical protein